MPKEPSNRACPFRVIALCVSDTDNRDPGFLLELALCQREECSWWDGEMGDCAVLSLASSLRGIDAAGVIRSRNEAALYESQG